jgi:putative phosphoesterase
MKFAVISDIHSNLEALNRTFEEIDRHSIDQIICLGDVVGYGAEPSKCLEMVCQQADLIIMGNHDRAVEDLLLRESFNDWAREAIEWTAQRLSDEEKREIRQFAPIVIDESRDITWTHGSVHEVEKFKYIFDSLEAAKSFAALSTRIAFFGHTHIPCFFSRGCREVRHLKPGVVRLDSNERYLINPGSVGQPRDRDPRLSFGIFDSREWSFELLRLSYDNTQAADKIRAANLPAFLADRLL